MSTSSDIAMRRSCCEPDPSRNDWTLVLAGGTGTRLASYVQARFGQPIPKQYCKLLGSRSMLEHTLDRLNCLTPSSNTLTVIGTDHTELAAPQLKGRSDHVFCQPCSRDTGVALYVALAMIRHWTPDALVTITPADHYVRPASTYLEQLRMARAVASRLRDTIVMLGVRPDEPDPEFGYVLRGDQAARLPRVHHVVGFVEKPDERTAKRLASRGALWNTMLTCSTLEALWQLARETQPALLAATEQLSSAIGTEHEDDAIRSVYETQDPINWSRDMLERAPARLAVMELTGVEWSDWGRPQRVEATLASRARR